MPCYKEIFSLALIITTGCWEDLHDSSQTLLLALRPGNEWHTWNVRAYAAQAQDVQYFVFDRPHSQDKLTV